MALTVKPWTLAGVIAASICIIFCVGLAAYHLSAKPWTHHGDPHHITTGLDTANHTEFENTHPHAMDHVHQSNTEHTHMPNKTECHGFEWECNIRLDPDVYPVHYDIYLYPQIELGIFDGRVTLTLNVTTQVRHIRIHMKDLEITKSTFFIGRTEMEFEDMLIYEPNEFLVFFFTVPLEPEQYKLHIEFRGNLTRGIVGLYRSQYKDAAKNTTEYVIASKFQPTYARRAFPCMDEPGFKSTFSVSLVKPTKLMALSNMPISEEEADSPTKGLTTVHFQKSVPMVTYLVAVAIGDFDFRTGETESGTPVRVLSTRFQVAKTEYAAEVAPKMIDFYEKYFDIKYPLPKMDIIGIPDFVSGAMEHWGLISFRESNLLYQPGTSSAANKQRIGSVLAHELSHQFFGNLMTLKWWNDLWLNEGFASYCEYKAVNHVHPDWEIEAQFVSQDLTPVLVLDGKHSSHPIVQPVSHPDQITEIFDSISYNKGASVIRMLEYLIGPTAFQQGVSNFLKDFSYANAETSDLWAALQAEVGQRTNISLLMDTWTRQMGYPVLEMETSDGSVTIRQSRFLANPNQTSVLSESPFDYKWEIPLRLPSDISNNTFPMNSISHKEKTLTLRVPPDTKWTKINTDYYGFFRVKYSNEGWNQIKEVYHSSFTPPERCGLIDDIFSLAYSTYLTYDLALDFGQLLQNESHFVPWDCADNHLRKISKLLENSAPESYSYFRKYVRNITSTLFNQFSWTDAEDEKHLDRLLKIRIFFLSCSHGEPECLKQTKEMFNNWLTNGFVIPPGLRPAVYKWGMWQATEEVWNTVWNRYLNESDSQERVRLLSALASTQQSWILRHFISLAQNESLVRRQDFFTVMNFVARNPIGNPIVWSFYRNNYESLVKRFTVNNRYLGRLIYGITAYYSTSIQLQEMEQFFAMYPVAGAGARARQTALETVKNNIEWEQRNERTISKWLKAN